MVFSQSVGSARTWGAQRGRQRAGKRAQGLPQFVCLVGGGRFGFCAGFTGVHGVASVSGKGGGQLFRFLFQFVQRVF